LEELQTIKGIGRDKAIALQSAFTLARRMAAEIREAAPVLDHVILGQRTTDRAQDYFSLKEHGYIYQ
jgi:hypothetical protein